MMFDLLRTRMPAGFGGAEPVPLADIRTTVEMYGIAPADHLRETHRLSAMLDAYRAAVHAENSKKAKAKPDAVN